MNEVLIADKITDKITGERLHSLPDSWLGARVVGWMYSETPGNWWVTGYLSDGKMKCASSKVGYAPSMLKQEFALKVLRAVNRHCNFGGAWLAGFLDKDYLEEFYLLWKDEDGDIRIPIEYPCPFESLLGCKLDKFCEDAAEAHPIYTEWKRDMDYSKSQLVKRAQGEKESGVIIPFADEDVLDFKE